MFSVIRQARFSRAGRIGPPVGGCDQAAFTLLELLVVMAIMALISTAMISSFFGAQRAASYTAAAADVRNSLLLARQRACLDGVKVYFVLMTNGYDDVEFSCTDYAIIHPMGKLTGEDPTDEDKDPQKTYFYDAYTDLESMVGRQTVIYNLNNMRRGDVTIEYRAAVPESPYEIYSPFYRFEVEDATGWSGNETYGILLHPVQRLPKGFYFRWVPHGESPSEDPLSTILARVIFKPDGSVEARNANNSDASMPVQIQVIEKIAKDRSDNRINLEIGSDGKVTIR